MQCWKQRKCSSELKRFVLEHNSLAHFKICMIAHIENKVRKDETCIDNEHKMRCKFVRFECYSLFSFRLSILFHFCEWQPNSARKYPE